MFRSSEHVMIVRGSKKPMNDGTLWENGHIKMTQRWYNKRREIRRMRKRDRRIKIIKDVDTGGRWRRRYGNGT